MSQGHQRRMLAAGVLRPAPRPQPEPPPPAALGGRPAAEEKARAAPPPARRPPPVAPQGPLTGADLRRAREQHGITLEHIASVTKLSVRTLQDIENDRSDRLPVRVYLHSFVQQYAREVGLEPRAAADAYFSRPR